MLTQKSLWTENSTPDTLFSMPVETAENILDNHNIILRIDCTGQCLLSYSAYIADWDHLSSATHNALFLATTKGYTPAANDGIVSLG
jgi:hypothetical protein